MAKLKNVVIRWCGIPIAPRTNINNIADPDTGETVTVGGGGGTTPTSVKYASSAGIASNVTASLKTELINSAAASVPVVTNVESANVAESLIETAKADIVNSAVNSVPVITSVASAGVADTVATTERNAIITSAVAAVPTTTFVESAGVADAVTAEYKASLIDSAVVAVSTGYTGPWCISKHNDSIVIGSGVYWLGDTLHTYQGSSLVSANGDVYFYTYYQGGTYYSGITIAQDSSTLPNAATGSAGYYTIIGNVAAQGITQYQYGTFRIDGRLV